MAIFFFETHLNNTNMITLFFLCKYGHMYVCNNNPLVFIIVFFHGFIVLWRSAGSSDMSHIGANYILNFSLEISIPIYLFEIYPKL